MSADARMSGDALTPSSGFLGAGCVRRHAVNPGLAGRGAPQAPSRQMSSPASSAKAARS